MKDSAERLRGIRKLRGLSQSIFAKELGIALRSYQHYESGNYPIPESLLHALARMGVSVHWLLTGDGDMNAPIREEVARLEALANYWQANYKLLEANINNVRVKVKERYSEEVAAELCDVLLSEVEVKIQFPHPAGKAGEVIAVAEEGKKEKRP